VTTMTTDLTCIKCRIVDCRDHRSWTYKITQQVSRRGHYCGDGSALLYATTPTRPRLLQLRLTAPRSLNCAVSYDNYPKVKNDGSFPFPLVPSFARCNSHNCSQEKSKRRVDWLQQRRVDAPVQWRTGPTGPPAMGRWAPAVSHLWGPLYL